MGGMWWNHFLYYILGRLGVKKRNATPQNMSDTAQAQALKEATFLRRYSVDVTALAAGEEPGLPRQASDDPLPDVVDKAP